LDFLVGGNSSTVNELSVDGHGRGGMNAESFALFLALIHGEMKRDIQVFGDSLDQASRAVTFTAT
jgi:hypothetical protein